MSEQLNIMATLFSGLSEKTSFSSITLTMFEHFNIISFDFTVPLFIPISFFIRFSDTSEHFNTISFELLLSDNGTSVLVTFFTILEHFICIPLILPILSV